MLANGSAAPAEMAAAAAMNRQAAAATRSQDDATVGYFFQRPQTDPDFQNFKHNRWAVGDDSVLEVRTNDAEFENDFQSLSIENNPLEIHSAKKLWGVDDGKNDDSKGLFLGDQWREPWTAASNNTSEHAMSNPIMVQRRSGSYPGGETNTGSVLSPRSTDTGGLGVKMVEYVLGTSPTSKDLESRMARLHATMNNENDDKNKKKRYDASDKSKETDRGSQAVNGIVPNGVDDDKGFNRTPGSRQPSPSEDDAIRDAGLLNDTSHLQKQTREEMINSSQNSAMMHSGNNPRMPRLNHFEPVGMDPLAFTDYSSQIMGSMDSPNLDNSFQRQHLQPQQAQPQNQQAMPPVTSLPQLFAAQHYAALANAAMVAQQQQQQQPQQQPSQPQGTSQSQQQSSQPQQQNQQPQLGIFPTSPYIINPQDPYAAAMGTIVAGPAVMPQYYGVAPWGVYPTNLIQQQSSSGSQGQVNNQQQQPAQQQMLRNNNGRPLTPQSNPSQGPDQSSNGTSAPPPGPGQYQVLAPAAYYDQNGSLVMPQQQGPGRGMANAAGAPPAMRLVSPAPLLVNHNHGSSNGHLGFPNSATQNNTSSTNLGYSSTNSLGNLGSPAVGPINIGIGNNSAGSPQQRSDSLDRRSGGGEGPFNNSGIGNDPNFSHLQNRTHPNSQSKGTNGNNQQYYGPLGGVSASPGSMGMTGVLSSNGCRIISAAPGAEAKYMQRNGSLQSSNSIFSNSTNTLFPNRTVPRNLDKSTGRSRLLEDFRNNRLPNLQLRDLTHHIVEFSQDQHGSRFIQQKLERASPGEKQMVFNEILTSAYGLMTDVFGNYVIQKFFEFGTNEQKQLLAQNVRGHVLPLALQMYGCRVIQKALESIPQDQQKDLVKELDGHVLKCVKDQNGNHVVQKCIECVEPLSLQFIINAFQGQVFALSTHPYGCRVIQRILEHCTGEQTTPILDELHQHTEQLVQDQYGNYVIQHVLEHGQSEDKSKIVAELRGKVLHLSQHKFASNVVEKCVTHSSRTERALLIEEVCSFSEGNHSALYIMMKDQYANYVVQKMIDVAEQSQRKILMHKIRPHVSTLRKYTYGKHILAKLEKYFLRSNDLGPIGAPPNAVRGVIRINDGALL